MDLSPISLIDVSAASAVAIKQLQGARSVTVKVLDAAILAASKEAIENTLTAELSGELESTLEMHTLMNGERSGGGSDPDEWESQLDDAVAELFKEKLEPFMGPGFVGEHSVDTRLHEPERIEEFARIVAKGVAERMVTTKETAEQIESLFDKEAIKAAGKEKPKDDGYKAVVVIVLADYLGKHSEDGLMDLLDLAADDEPVLALGPLETLAANYVNKEEIGRCMRVWKANSANWREEAIAGARRSLQPASVANLAVKKLEYVEGPDSAPPSGSEKPKRTRKKKGETAAPAAETDEEREARELAELIGDVPTPAAAGTATAAATSTPSPTSAPVSAPVPLEAAGAVETASPGALTALRLLKEHGRITETELAEKLGLSRSTINNMVREKIACDLNGGQRKVLADAIDVHLKGLAAARASLGVV